ncbi:hypothetical protein [Pyrobaculum calidifontis]|uniref:Uncharacterized protein n=1 Tax=Pyrobaculum calidifontis (strain DSM 21063 / JCM 11548 / VA1) TaxID=410359 RepID=A3MXC4_PYRCJ|nr:hypothetical protein [Pyrobaculum calidifontis]ABO09291.1 hypothetical protein Pcal_1875 [Pyrobaculum calidifontis JCM 11548]
MASVVYGLYPRQYNERSDGWSRVVVLGVGVEGRCRYFPGCRAVPLLVFEDYLSSLLRVLDLTNAYLAYPSASGGPFRLPLKAGDRLSPYDMYQATSARYLVEYLKPVLKRYGVEGPWSIFSRVRVPGRGAHLDERFAVYAIEGEYLQMESPEGVVPAFRFVLGTVGDRWVLMGKDGLYTAAFIEDVGPSGRVGYAVVEGPYWGEVRAVEGPPFLGDVLPSTPSVKTNCPLGALQVGDSEVCVRDDEVFHIATRWPLAAFRGTPGQYAVRLAQLLHKKYKAKLATVNT